jgi:putative transposase
MVINRSRQHASNLSALDRFLLGFWSPFLSPHYILRAAIITKPSSLLKLHKALQKRKYRLLFSARKKGKPRPKGQSQELIQGII